MIVEYSTRALGDVARIGERSRAEFGPAIVREFEERLREVELMLADNPNVGRRFRDRPGVRRIPLGRFPFLVIYRVLPNAVRILHVRHTSRLPW